MVNMMKKKIKWLLLAAAVHASTLMAADILKTDSYFTAQQYDLAKAGYIEAAKLGNPHAYYQLARMYARGLGVKQDVVNALIYYSLAAEYDYFDAQKVIDNTLATLSTDSKASFIKVMEDYKVKLGKQAIDAKYFPVILQGSLPSKVTFDGNEKLKHLFYSEDFMEDSIANLNNLAIEEGGNEDATYMSTPKEPYLILDIDIAADGSIRNYFEVQNMGGSAKRLINEFILFPQPKPSINNQHISFVHRVFLGAAVYSKSILIDKNEPMYAQILRTSKKLKQGTTLNERYQYAMALLNFPWLTSEPQEAEQKLLAIAKLGHPSAMYEYGMLLYREQRNIPEAIEWISQSSKYGLIRAEYRLGMLLNSSPWVQQDQSKALFWFSSAMSKGDINSAIRAIDIKLTAKDKSLYDIESAVQDLKNIEHQHDNNPEYYYLLALSYRDREARDFSQFVRNMRTAISRGISANWDTREWQSLLEKSTVGTVYITDE
ncbi:sel1 repeat family protein [Pseudoalteromonas sp. APC 3355]|uniref:tetratricopeptide repeat protein n=1 Tax=Pseudoalteromonas sp. APC 3355 TaxID=3035199 RepID=UPI0025B2E020|nr:sel1 repeat family protein [Pseudoalteromonas sp. APC 3355]MDN3476447.1 sel1 repeat family protein [Pseudoalteromonas sp. APC 3355]